MPQNSVEAPGIETDLWQIESTEEHRSGTISTDDDPANVSDRASKCATVRGVVAESPGGHELSNVVETAREGAASRRRRRALGDRESDSRRACDSARRAIRGSESRSNNAQPMSNVQRYLAIGRSP